MSNAVNMTDYAWNITCLNELGFYIVLNLPKYYMWCLEYVSAWLKENVS